MSDHLIAEANRHLRALTIERDQFRTELALLREWQREVIQNANLHHAELRGAIDRAKRAEAELAAERARLDYLSTLGFKHRHHETGDHLGYEWTISSYSESGDITLRNLIDEQMIVNPREKEVRDE